MSFAYTYDYSIEIIVTFPVEGQVSSDDERYLFVLDDYVRRHHTNKYSILDNTIDVFSLLYACPMKANMHLFNITAERCRQQVKVHISLNMRFVFDLYE